MAGDATLEREGLLSFLAAVPTGKHVAVCLRWLTPDDAIRACEEAAMDASEQLVVAPGDEDLARLPQIQLAELAAAARSAGKRGVLLAVDGDGQLDRDDTGHVRAEQTLGPELPPGVRLFCFYTPRSATHWENVLPPHAERLDQRSRDVA